MRDSLFERYFSDAIDSPACFCRQASRERWQKSTEQTFDLLCTFCLQTDIMNNKQKIQVQNF